MHKTDSPILTIGHFNHTLDAFIALLQQHRVTALADVRSAPYSRFAPQFNHDSIGNALNQAGGIAYVYLGCELGGRTGDPACYGEDGRIRYDQVAETTLFRRGLDRVIRGASKYRIALRCSEKEPLDCHRALLVAQALDECDVEVVHIHDDGELERHSEAMNRLLGQLKLRPEGDLFRRTQPRRELIAEAVARQAARVAFVAEKLADISMGPAQ